MNERAITVALAVASVLLGGLGCEASAYETLRPVTDFGRSSLVIYETVWWWSLGIFVVVEVLLLFALWRFRRRAADTQVPEQVHGHTLLEVGWTLAPAMILLFFAIPTVRTIFRQQAPPPAEAEALEIAVIGHQWWWEIVYPGLEATTANEIHVPVGRTVQLSLTSADVIHSFWAPRLGGKRDLNPGSENRIVFTADSTGVFEGQCAEFCGVSHANMRLRVFVDEPERFQTWVEAQRRETPPDSAGFLTFLVSGCAACHAIGGTPAQARVGPDLTHVGSRTTLAAGLLPNTPEAMAAWLRNPDSLKPAVLMPDLNLSEARVDTLVSFLQALR